MKDSSNNTNKLSPQEPSMSVSILISVQIIQINLVLKNTFPFSRTSLKVQIIQINLVLKNNILHRHKMSIVQIIQINLVLKNRMVSTENT